MKIFSLEQIQESINISEDFEELINSQKTAFIDYSASLYNVPSPMQFVFPGSRSDCHIKGGYRQGGEHFVVKVAGSSKFGNNGAVLVFDVESYELKSHIARQRLFNNSQNSNSGNDCASAYALDAAKYRDYWQW